MSNYRKLPTAASCPDVDWFESLPLPEGRTFNCLGREQVALDDVLRTNEDGQVINLARELGTNRENVQNLVNSIKIKGVLLDAQPPFLGTNDSLYDGFTRFEAILSLGLEHWVFNIVEPKEGFTWDDVWDEIGLGANDHPPSKAATRGDFKKRLARWVALQEETPTQGQCVDWINSIPHSFSQEIVTNIAQEVLKQNRASSTMESVDPKIVAQRVSQAYTNRVRVIPVNISGNKTYFKRAIFEALEAKSNPKVSEIVGVAYLKDTPAEQAEETRQSGLKTIDQYNDWFEQAFQERLKVGASYRLFDINYIYPQIIDEETEMIKVERRGE